MENEVLVFFLVIITFIYAQKKYYKLVITNINENHKTNQFKRPSKLFF